MRMGLAFRVALFVALVAFGKPSRALAPDRALSQLDLTRWTLKDGAPPDIWSLAETENGYLWLGTGAGLFRFDGMTFERFRPDAGSFRSTDIDSLLSLPGNRLLVGYHAGGASLLENGVLRDLSRGLPAGRVYLFARDQDGRIWMTYDNPDATKAGVYLLNGDHWTEVSAAMGIPGNHEYVLRIAPDGTIWLAGASLMYLPKGAHRFTSTGLTLDDVTQMNFAPDGNLWFTRRDQTLIVDIPELLAGKGERAVSAPILRGDYYGPGMVFDRDGVFWWAARTQGVFRIRREAQHPGAGGVEFIDQKDGLTINVVRPVLEDREGNIWIGSSAGLNRLSAPLVTQASNFPTSFRSYSAARTATNRLYLAGGDGLYEVGDDAAPALAARLDRIGTICPIGGDQLLVGLAPYERKGLFRWDGQVLARQSTPHSEGQHLAACAVDQNGRLWSSSVGDGLYRVEGQRWQRVAVPDAPPEEAPRILTPDSDGVWAYYPGRSLIHLSGNRVDRRISEAAIGIGDIQVIVRVGDRLLMGGDRGVAQWRGGRLLRISAEREPELERVTGIAVRGDGTLWIYGINGIIRSRLAAFGAALERGTAWKFDLLNARNGVPGTANQDNYKNTIGISDDGRLWFFASQGVFWLDNDASRRPQMAPPVVIRAMHVDGVPIVLGRVVKLAAGTSTVAFDYTALSLTQPEAIRFRYRLSGPSGQDWTDAGGQRYARFSNLAPGDYRFQVIAETGGGVWNWIGATVEFRIAPAFVQSVWFKLAISACLAGLIWAIYRLRLIQITSRLRERGRERERERERIARDLHDTLLQSFHGLILRFHALVKHVPETLPVHAQMEHALDAADTAVVEGRESIHALRNRAEPDSLAAVLDQAVEQAMFLPNVRVRATIDGEPRPLRTGVLDEIARIVGEALSNAARHANPQSVQVTARYTRSELLIRVSDDGRGIDRAILEAGEREGHLGLLTMRERCRGLGGRLEIDSQSGSGTWITLSLPAWRTFRRRGPSLWFGELNSLTGR